MKVRNKRALVVCVILAMGLGILTVSHSMKRSRDEPEQPQYKSEFFGPLDWVSDVKERIERTAVHLMLKDAVWYLNSGKPIALEVYNNRTEASEFDYIVAANRLFISFSTGLVSGDIRVWDIFSKSEQSRLRETDLSGSVMNIGVMGDRVIGLSVGTMQIWDMLTGNPLYTFQLEWSEALRKIDIFNMTNGYFRVPEGYTSVGNNIATYGKLAVVTDNWHPWLFVFDMSTETPKLLHILKHRDDGSAINDDHDGGGVGSSFTIDNNKVISAIGWPDYNVKTWDINTGELVREFTLGDNGPVKDISGNYVLTVEGFKYLYTIWDVKTGEKIIDFPFSDPGKVLVSKKYLFFLSKSSLLGRPENERAIVTVVDIKSGRTVGRWYGSPGRDVEMKRSGETLIMKQSGSFDEGIPDMYYVWPFELLLDGTVESNPLLWITKINPKTETGILQAHFIKRAYEATIAKQDLIIDMPQSLSTPQEDETQEQADGRTYFSFPEHVRQYLRDRLNIRR